MDSHKYSELFSSKIALNLDKGTNMMIQILEFGIQVKINFILILILMFYLYIYSIYLFSEGKVCYFISLYSIFKVFVSQRLNRLTPKLKNVCVYCEPKFAISSTFSQKRHFDDIFLIIEIMALKNILKCSGPTSD